MKLAGRRAGLAVSVVVIALAALLAVAAAADAKGRKRGPIDAKVTVDKGRAARVTITAAGGGRLAITARNGTKITISFPAGAVAQDTLVTATAVTKLASPKLRPGLLAGVQLAPEGLQLLKPAAVRFARHGKAPKRRHLVFVGSGGTGRDVYRLPPPVKLRGQGRKRRPVPTGAPVVSISHFSTTEGFDWSTATVAELDAINVPQLGVDLLAQQIAKLFAEHASLEEILDAMERARLRFIEPLLATAATKLTTKCSQPSIRYAMSALLTAAGFDRQVALLGGEAGVALPSMRSLLPKVADCMTTLCPTLGDPRAAIYLLGLARQLQVMGIVDSLAYFAALDENIARCGTFEVHLDSRIDDALAVGSFSMRIEGSVKYVPSMPARPRGALTYTATSGSVVDTCETTEIMPRSDGELELTDVSLGRYDPDEPSTPPVLSLTLTVTTLPMEALHTRYAPTDPSCEPNTLPPDSPTTLWSVGFGAEHPGGAFPGTDFVRDVAPKFAVAVYSGRPVAFGGGTFTENTLVELIHTPQPPVPLPEIRGS